MTGVSWCPAPGPPCPLPLAASPPLLPAPRVHLRCSWARSGPARTSHRPFRGSPRGSGTPHCPGAGPGTARGPSTRRPDPPGTARTGCRRSQGSSRAPAGGVRTSGGGKPWGTAGPGILGPWRNGACPLQASAAELKEGPDRTPRCGAQLAPLLPPGLGWCSQLQAEPLPQLRTPSPWRHTASGTHTSPSNLSPLSRPLPRRHHGFPASSSYQPPPLPLKPNLASCPGPLPPPPLWSKLGGGVGGLFQGKPGSSWHMCTNSPGRRSSQTGRHNSSWGCPGNGDRQKAQPAVRDGQGGGWGDRQTTAISA